MVVVVVVVVVVVATASHLWQARTYLRWKAAISLGKAILSGLLYASLRLPLWPIVAFLVFWFNWIPIFGAFAAILLPLPIALIDASTTWLSFTLLLALPTLMHLLVDNVLDQLVMARAMLLHPVVIVVGVFAAQRAWGILGMALSVPLLSAAKTVLASTPHPYALALAAVLEGDWRSASMLSSGASLGAQLAADADAIAAAAAEPPPLSGQGTLGLGKAPPPQGGAATPPGKQPTPLQHLHATYRRTRVDAVERGLEEAEEGDRDALL